MSGYFKKNEIVIQYNGGLGNQMFQYAVACNYEKRGKKVKHALFHYDETPDVMPFVLNKVFQNIVLEIADPDRTKAMMQENNQRSIKTKIINKLFPATIKYYCEGKELRYDARALKLSSAVLTGYWQSYRYAQNTETLIRKKFKFSKIEDEKTCKLIEKMKSENSVSVHIRAGDYLQAGNAGLFGGICTQQYYEKAIVCMNQKISNPLFFVFSNDIDWCKRNIPLANVVWMDNETLPEHEDWIEMYLMSCCKHNIIANSSFSWWAAWLNENKYKMVIAPEKWINHIENDEMCPPDWIRI